MFHKITELDIAFQIRKWRRNLKLELQTNIKLVIRDLCGGYLCVKITGCRFSTEYKFAYSCGG